MGTKEAWLARVMVDRVVERDGREELQRKRLRIRLGVDDTYALTTSPFILLFSSPHLSTRFACKCVAKFGSKLLGQDTNPPQGQQGSRCRINLTENQLRNKFIDRPSK